MPQTTQQALSMLYNATEDARKGFPDILWTRLAGGGPDELKSSGYGSFEGLKLEKGVSLLLETKLELPGSAQQCALSGEPLEATLNSLYPVDLYWNDELRFEAEGTPVASGPALFTLIPELCEGDNGALRIRIRMPDNQPMNWFTLYLTTPSLRHRAETIDAAWAQLAMADALAITPAERAAVDCAAANVPENVAETNTSDLNSYFAGMVETLSPLADRIRLAPRVHLIGHSHIDMNWLWTLADTDNTIVRDMKSVLSLLDDYPELTFSHSQPATYAVFRREEPALFDKIVEHIRAGRWEPTTMQWVEGDVNMAAGEAQARQLLQAVRYTRDVLGATPTVFHAPDTFGHAGNLPQLAVSAGAKYYYHHRANEGQENQWPAYWWEGQDGSRILGISTYGYNGEITARDIATASIRAHKFGHPAAMHFHGIGDHGGGPARQNLDTFRRIKQRPLLPRAFCSTEGAYAREIVESGVSLPVHYGESSTIFEGCYTTHADTKYYNRTGENVLTTADTLAALSGQNHNDDLDKAWRKVLYNQFHDILDGSAIHESYEQNKADFEEAVGIGSSVIDSALKASATADENLVTVYNPLGFDREDWVTIPGLSGDGVAFAIDSKGLAVPGQYTTEGFGFVARVAALSSATYRISKPATGDKLPDSLVATPAYAPTHQPGGGLLAQLHDRAPYYAIETSAFKAYIRRDCGIIVSLYDKRANRQLVGFGLRRGSDYVDTARPDLALNVFQLVEEHPHGMSSWQYQEVWSEQSLLKGATTEVVESGPARLVLKVTHALRSSAIEQRIIFYREIGRIDFETNVDWQELGDETKGVPNLKAAFTAHLPEAEAWFETPFAAVRRPADGQETPALRWADVGGPTYGIALLNDSKYGYDALGNRLRLTLVRSGYEPDTISDIGQHHIRYSLFPHVGDWRTGQVVRAGLAYNQPLIALNGEPEASGTITPTISGSQSILLSCLKNAHSGAGIIARFYEGEGTSGEVSLGDLPLGARVTEVNIVEDAIRSVPVSDGRVTLGFKPWQIRTLLIG